MLCEGLFSDIHLILCSRDRDYRRDERHDDGSGHRDLREEYSGHGSHGMSGAGSGSGRQGHGSRDSRSESCSVCFFISVSYSSN